ncbi:MAG: TRCF domain-containing protein [Pseudomonadota bacterium]
MAPRDSIDPTPQGADLAAGVAPGTGAPALTPGRRERAEAAPERIPAAAVAAAAATRLGVSAVTTVLLAAGERRAAEIARAAAAFAPAAEVLTLPGWDCLPFDRASPSRDIMGRRMATLARLATDADRPRLLVLSPAALLQRVPATVALQDAFLTLRVGDILDREALTAYAARAGYVADDRIDEPGEVALLGEVVDLFPAAAAEPVRIHQDADGRIAALRTYDPLTQRTRSEVAWVTLAPASEAILAQDGGVDREAGVEHRLADLLPLTDLFALTPGARLLEDPGARARLAAAEAQRQDAAEAIRAFSGASPDTRLYLSRAEAEEGLAAWKPGRLALSRTRPTPVFANARNPGRAFCDVVARETAAGRTVVLAGLEHEMRSLRRALARGLDRTLGPAATWQDILAAPPGGVWVLEGDLDAGFGDGARTVIAAADVLGGRLAARRGPGLEAAVLEPELRPGDVVLHEDHGVGVLRDLEVVELDGVVQDTLRLEYRGGASVLAPVGEIDRIWRYGAAEDAVSLDRLGGDAWPRRRAEADAHVDQTARALADLAAARAARTADPITPPKAAYTRFEARFGYPDTPDQAAAISAVLEDLASGRPMDRLVCGDVGFGKTEVALRAAAAVALSGRQVAVAAPTTVLARQHFLTFSRRFAGTGVEVVHLSRLEAAADRKAAKAALASGAARIVVGTHAVAADDMAFADLALVIVDEEQKFGAADKARLRALCGPGHLLTLTATPIPRTLQAAMVGLQDLSLIASPPARRRPIRTFVAPFDPGRVRAALLREARRGGQSFVVAPRIEDLPALRAQLAELAPDLWVRVAHGDMAPEAVDEVMVGFADGQGDVLLATSLIESGLDVPRANTMLIWRPDRFGLAQLHQLRGRVGRGRAQGVAYLLTDPAEALSDAVQARLSTLEAFDRLGAGLAISARDLDLRGAGDLLGEDQAGHVRLVGVSLYQALLTRALRAARGQAAADGPPPVLRISDQGVIPADYVPDAVVRINLYARLARLETEAEIDAFEDELGDRFGALPDAVLRLLDQARVQRLGQAAGICAISAGPKGLALTVGPARRAAALRRVHAVQPDAALRDARVVVPGPGEDPAWRLKVLRALAPPSRGPRRRSAAKPPGRGPRGAGGS